MEIPANIKTYDMTTSTMWFDQDGILFSVPKPNAPTEQSKEEMNEEMDKFREITGGKKVCMVLETNHNSRPPKKEERDFIAEQLTSVTKAMAIVTSLPLSRMVANLFFGFKPPPYPVKMFSNEKEAKEWVKQYL
jgi:hypothetical protein